MTEEDEEDGVVEKVTGTGGHIDGGEGWLDVDAEGDEIKTKVRLALKTSKRVTKSIYRKKMMGRTQKMKL